MMIQALPFKNNLSPPMRLIRRDFKSRHKLYNFDVRSPWRSADACCNGRCTPLPRAVSIHSQCITSFRYAISSIIKATSQYFSPSSASRTPSLQSISRSRNTSIRCTSLIYFAFLDSTFATPAARIADARAQQQERRHFKVLVTIPVAISQHQAAHT